MKITSTSTRKSIRIATCTTTSTDTPRDALQFGQLDQIPTGHTPPLGTERASKILPYWRPWPRRRKKGMAHRRNSCLVISLLVTHGIVKNTTAPILSQTPDHFLLSVFFVFFSTKTEVTLLPSGKINTVRFPCKAPVHVFRTRLKLISRIVSPVH